MNLLTQTET